MFCGIVSFHKAQTAKLLRAEYERLSPGASASVLPAHSGRGLALLSFGKHRPCCPILVEPQCFRQRLGSIASELSARYADSLFAGGEGQGEMESFSSSSSSSF